MNEENLETTKVNYNKIVNPVNVKILLIVSCIFMSILFLTFSFVFYIPHKIKGLNGDAYSYEHELNNDREIRSANINIGIAIAIVFIIISIIIDIGLDNEEYLTFRKDRKYAKILLFGCGIILFILHIVYILLKRGVFNKKKDDKVKVCAIEGKNIIYNLCVGNRINELYDKCIKPLKKREREKCETNLVSYNNILEKEMNSNKFNIENEIKNIQDTNPSFKIKTYNLYKNLDTKCSINSIGKPLIEITKDIKAYQEIKMLFEPTNTSGNKKNLSELLNEKDLSSKDFEYYMILDSRCSTKDNNGNFIGGIDNLINNNFKSNLNCNRVVNYKIHNNTRYSYCLNESILNFQKEDKYKDCKKKEETYSKYNEKKPLREVTCDENNKSQFVVKKNSNDEFGVVVEKKTCYEGYTFNTCGEKKKYLDKIDKENRDQINVLFDNNFQQPT